MNGLVPMDWNNSNVVLILKKNIDEIIYQVTTDLNFNFDSWQDPLEFNQTRAHRRALSSIDS